MLPLWHLLPKYSCPAHTGIPPRDVTLWLVHAHLVHYWLLQQRGGEAVLEAFCNLFPSADIFTAFYDPHATSETIRNHHVRSSILNPLRRFHRALTAMVPLVLERFDLRDYDLVISSESAPAKAVMLASYTRHICYCHTPPRYLWDPCPAYRLDRGSITAALANQLRAWDLVTAQRVDEFIANSENVRRRIQRCYRREAEVIYPPVAVENFCWKSPEDYFLLVGELTPYKQFDRAVRLFSRTGRRLLVVGDGHDFGRLRRLASGNVEFCGRVSEEELRELYARSRGLIVPGEEDFGTSAVEALASGKGVIAYGRGGVLETVPADDPPGVSSTPIRGRPGWRRPWSVSRTSKP